MSRRLALLAVLLVSQGTGLVLVATIVVLQGDAPPELRYAAFASLSGAAGAIGVAAFFRGLAVGAMSVVAPISAIAAAIPVTVGLATGERPSALQGLGILLAIAGAVLASHEPVHGDAGDADAGDGTGGGDGDRDPEHASPHGSLAEAGREPAALPPRALLGGRRVAAGTGLALVAALGFGWFFVAMGEAAQGGVFWAMLFNRATSVTLLVLATLALRPRLRARPVEAIPLVSIGVFDTTANALFAVATTKGLVSLAAVLGSLYPVVTIFLARAILSERISRLQQLGVATALTGVVLITGG